MNLSRFTLGDTVNSSLFNQIVSEKGFESVKPISNPNHSKKRFTELFGSASKETNTTPATPITKKTPIKKTKIQISVKETLDEETSEMKRSLSQKLVNLMEDVVINGKNEILPDISTLSQLGVQIGLFAKENTFQNIPIDILKNLTEILLTQVDVVANCPNQEILSNPTEVSKSFIAAISCLKILNKPDCPNELTVLETLNQIVTLCKTYLAQVILPQMESDIKDPMLHYYSEILLALHQISILGYSFSDQHLTILLDMCLDIIFVNLGDLYHFAMNLLVLLFSKHVKQREYILNEIVLRLLKSASEKKWHNFRVDTQNIAFFTSLILQLLESIARPSQALKREINQESIDKAAIKDIFDSQWEDVETTSKSFCILFFTKCCQNDLDGDYKSLVIKFVDDLLLIKNNSAFSICHFVLATLFESLNDFLTDKNDKIKSMFLGLIGKIASHSRNATELQDVDLDCKTIHDIGSKSDLTNVQLVTIEIADYLSKRRDENPIYEYSHHFLFLTLIKTCKVDVVLDLMEIWNNAPTFKFNKHEKMHHEDKYLSLLSQTSPLVQSFENMLNFILVSLKDVKITIRSQAMKCLLYIIETDASVLEWPQVLQVIKERSNDESPKVRESIISILGTVFTSSVKYIPKYLDFVMDRLMDDAPSVRKKSITILADMIDANLVTDSQITRICSLLSQRLFPTCDESDSIKNHIHKLFVKVWFLENNVLSLVDVLSTKSISWKEVKTHWFVHFVKKCNEKEVKNLSKMVENLMDHIISIENEPDSLFGQNSVSSCLSTLRLICHVDSKLLVPHYLVLFKYLDNTKMDLVYHTSSIFSMIMSNLKFDKNFEANFFKTVLNLIFASNNLYFDALVACVELICVTSVKIANFYYVGKVFENSYLTVSKFVQKKTREAREYESSARLLTTMGLFVRFLDFDSNKHKLEFSELVPGKIESSIFHLATSCFRLGNENLASRALQAIGQLFIKSPKLMIGKESLQIIESTFESNASLKRQMLMVLKDFLVEEEIKFSNNSKEQTDTGVTNTIIPHCLDRILNCFEAKEHGIRQDALTVIELSLRQGIVIPNQIIPWLIALEVDPDPHVRETVHKLNLYVESRHHHLLVTRIHQGLLFSFRLNSGDVSFDAFYTQIIKDFTISEKIGVLDSILKEVCNIKKHQPELICYLMKILIELPFGSTVEVLHILYKLNLLIDLEGSVVMEEDKNSKQIKSMSLLLEGRNILQSTWNISKSKFDEYDSSAPSKYKETKMMVRSVQILSNLETLCKQADRDAIVASFKSLLKDHMMTSSESFTPRKRRSPHEGSKKKKKKKKEESEEDSE